MTSPLEHDYIGLGEPSSAEHSDKLSSTSGDEGGGATSDLKRTELRLGLPGSDFPERTGGVGLTLALPKGSSAGAKRGFSDAIDGAGKSSLVGGRGSKVVSVKGASGLAKDVASASKAQVVGWPPIRNYRKNTMAVNSSKNKEVAEVKKTSECLFVKVSMDGAPYLRKVDLKTYSNYKELSLALEKMFTCFTIGQCSSHGISGRETLTESRMMDLFQGAEYVLSYEDKDGDWMLVGDVPWDMFTDSCRRLRIMKSSDAIGIAPRAMEKSKSQNQQSFNLRARGA